MTLELYIINICLPLGKDKWAHIGDQKQFKYWQDHCYLAPQHTIILACWNNTSMGFIDTHVQLHRILLPCVTESCNRYFFVNWQTMRRASLNCSIYTKILIKNSFCLSCTELVTYTQKHTYKISHSIINKPFRIPLLVLCFKSVKLPVVSWS